MTPQLEILTKEKLKFFEERSHRMGFSTPKWVMFSQIMLDMGFKVRYYDAKTTVSKYIYVRNPVNKIEVKIRFSNHKPNLKTELKGDSDFYVGVSNERVITTEQVIPQVISRLKGETK